MASAGTAEGWEETGRFRYSCPVHPQYGIEAHLAFIYYCEECGREVRGPQVEGFNK